MKPLAIDLFCGLGGWTDGLLAAGFDVVGFDITRHMYGESKYPAQLVLQDILTVHGSQFRDAAVIVASPPCQNYSYLAMPWSKSKCPLCKGKKVYFEWQLVSGVAPGHMTHWGKPIPCDCEENSKAAKALRKKWETEGPDNRLFDACFRIQREAIEATQKACLVCSGTGRELDPDGYTCDNCGGMGWTERRYIPLIVENVRGAVPWVGREKAKFGSFYLWGDVGMVGNRVFAGRDLADVTAGRGRFGMGVAPEGATKITGTGSWFFAADNPDAFCHRNNSNPTPAGMKSNQGAIDNKDGRKQSGAQSDWFSKAACDAGSKSRFNSKSNARKAASAMIAKIPLALSRYVAEQHFPEVDSGEYTAAAQLLLVAGWVA